MANESCFISSTILDLKDLRSFLSFELTSYGFTMLLSEQGTIPVDSSQHSYDICLQAARDCDILIAIIDGRFGGEVPGTGKSITLAEIEAALDAGKQVFTFVRQGVWDAMEILRPYLKDPGFRQSKIVTDARVFDVIDAIRKRPTGNWIFTFNQPPDILTHLSAQLNFALRNSDKSEADKLDQILARRFLTEFDERLMRRFIHDIQAGQINEDDTEAFEDAVSAFLPQTMRFAGAESAATFDDFMHKAVKLNSDLPSVFSPSLRSGWYSSHVPMNELSTGRQFHVDAVAALAVETEVAWRKFVDVIRQKWPHIIAEVHQTTV